MADNGRPFPHSKTRLNNQGVKTPFVVHFPKLNPTSRISKSLISSIDIAPTLIDLVEIEKPKSFQGVSFLNILKKPHESFRNYIFSEHNWHDYESYQRMVRNKRYLYIRNSRPKFPQEGPLDAINSPTYIDLKNAQKNGTISEIQSEIFINPRPKEELYDLFKDPYQFNNLLLDENNFNKNHIELSKVLNKWITETADNIPESITKDWYLREQEPYNESSLLKTEFHGIRGEMPGKLKNAIKINNKGPF